MNLKKIAVRAGSGLIYIALVVILVIQGSGGVFILSAFFAILATIEFDRISAPEGGKPIQLVGCDICANLALALLPISESPLPMVILCGCILFCRYILELYAGEKNPLRSLSTSLMSMVYIGLPLMTMSYLSVYLSGCENYPLLTVFIMIWLNDTGAYVVGSLIGRHKLAPTISPKKTWEGFLGGMLFTVSFGILCHYCFYPDLLKGATPTESFLIWIIYGIAVTLFATWGDLTESLIKRNLGLKDSGNIMPGHGGILDRIDSLLFVMPMTALFIFSLSEFTNFINQFI